MYEEDPALCTKKLFSDRSPDIDNESYDEDDQEEWSNDDISDPEAMDEDGRLRARKTNRTEARGVATARGRVNVSQRKRGACWVVMAIY